MGWMDRQNRNKIDNALLSSQGLGKKKKKPPPKKKKK